MRQDSFFEICSHELGFSVISREPKSHLSQIIGSNAEKFSMLCQGSSFQGSTWNFNHCSNLERDPSLLLSKHVLGCFLDNLELIGELFLESHQRHHDVREDRLSLCLNLDSSFNDGSGLHVCDIWMYNSKPASSEAHHWVCFIKPLEFPLENQVSIHMLPRLSMVHGNQVTAELIKLWTCMRQKLVQWRVQESNSHRKTIHSPENSNKVFFLIILQSIQSFMGFFSMEFFSSNHFSHSCNSFW
mmetsp:Transcript_3551/g.7210  ORF Transcript_3551/g.7210 Transcript_3551/m.7210 type:complete len:243 (+) Transcript_3551:1148-1876(+)